MECHLRCEHESVDLLDGFNGLCWAWQDGPSRNISSAYNLEETISVIPLLPKSAVSDYFIRALDAHQHTAEMIKESGDDDQDGLSGSSSGDEAAILHDLSRLRPPQKKQRREESVPFELLQQAG